MKEFIETPNLLKSIQADDLDQIYREITEKAVEWSVGGYLNYANRLLQDLWAFYSGDPGYVRMDLEGLQVMWELSGNYPDSIPFPFRELEHIEKENWGYITDNLTDRFEGKDIPAILNKLESLILEYPGQFASRLSAGAAILALDHGLIPEAEKFIQCWGREYMNGSTEIVGMLTRNRKVSSILLQGKLSAVLKLTESACKAEYEQLSAALKKRKESGRTLIYGDQSWASLLRNISALSIRQNTELYSEELISSQWLGNDPASEQELLTAERKIGMPLPPDYREFLKVSNGFLAHSYSSPGLARVEGIDWLSQFDDDVLDIVAGYIKDTLEEEKPKYPGLSTKCLLVSGMYEETEVLLFPTIDNDWQCWSLTLPGGCGETWYPSFRYYMEHQLYFLECEVDKE